MQWVVAERRLVCLSQPFLPLSCQFELSSSLKDSHSQCYSCPVSGILDHIKFGGHCIENLNAVNQQGHIQCDPGLRDGYRAKAFVWPSAEDCLPSFMKPALSTNEGHWITPDVRENGSHFARAELNEVMRQTKSCEALEPPMPILYHKTEITVNFCEHGGFTEIQEFSRPATWPVWYQNTSVLIWSWVIQRILDETG